MEAISLERSEVARKISLCSFKGDEAAWKQTDEAKRILEQIHAHEHSLKIYEERVKNLEHDIDYGRMRKSWMKLFTTSKMGMAILNTGAGKRSSTDQSRFKDELIEKYAALKPGKKKSLWCPILRTWRESCDMTDAHLFPYMHGQATMDAIFGKQNSQNSFRPEMGF